MSNPLDDENIDDQTEMEELLQELMTHTPILDGDDGDDTNDPPELSDDDIDSKMEVLSDEDAKKWSILQSKVSFGGMATVAGRSVMCCGHITADCADVGARIAECFAHPDYHRIDIGTAFAYVICGQCFQLYEVALAE